MSSSDDGGSGGTNFQNALVVFDDTKVGTPQATKRDQTRRGPESSKSTSRSLTDILALCNASKDVEFSTPIPEDRADNPPEGYFTVYEAYFRTCFLWFPIPRTILEYLWKNHLAISQITPRGMRCLVGLMIRSYENGSELGVDHLLSLLTVKKVGRKDKLHYSIDGKPDLRVIKDFPPLERFWEKKFFFVRINNDSVGDRPKLRKRWGHCVHTKADKFPIDLFDLHADFITEKCSWTEDFTLRRVREALIHRFGTQLLTFPPEMSSNGKRLTAREKRDAENRMSTTTRAPQGARSTDVPKSRRPELERNIAVHSSRRHDSPPKRRDVSNTDRKRARDENREAIGPGDLFSNGSMAATNMSKIVFPGNEFPPPQDMSRRDIYRKVALHGMTFIASINELTKGYETDATSQKRRLASVQELCDDHKKQRRQAETRVATLEAAVKETEDQRRKIDGTFSESEAERRRLQQEVASLTARLEDAARLQDASVQKAVDLVKFELKAEHESRIRRAREKLRAINDQPWTDIIDLTQVQSNIEFLALLQSDSAPDLNDELGELKKQEEGLLHADETFGKLMRELEEILGIASSDGGAPVVAAPIREVIHSASSSSSSSGDEDSSDSETEIETGQVTETVDGA